MSRGDVETNLWRSRCATFGKATDKISALGFGGHHLGDAKDEATAIQIVEEAIDGGVTFFDNCWEYNRGKSENWMGKALRGQRDKIFLMTKVCTHGRDASLALEMLEQSLRRLQTDHLDLWQIHGVSFDICVERIERHLHGIEGKPSRQHFKMEFRRLVPGKAHIAHLALLTITGMDKLEVLHQNLQIAQNFKPMTADEMNALRERCKPYAADGHYENYKTSLQFDNPEARWAHGFPIDTQQKEVKEMMKETDNTGLPYPELKT